mmetsp:Transcript_24307/g.37568  ORF Transcript_24307/g.37568 Transcript_24307/m.37568 type:complete len:146 (-) Transcript_24307:381-818(-)
MGVTSKGNSLLDVTEDPTDYSLLSVMTITDTAQNTEHDLYLLRDPAGVTITDTEWDNNSGKWTTELKNQLPYGVTPENFMTDGLLVLSKSEFFEAIEYTYVSQCKTGYSSNWYDVSFNFGPNFFSVDVPANDGDIYVSIEPFFEA